MNITFAEGLAIAAVLLALAAFLWAHFTKVGKAEVVSLTNLFRAELAAAHGKFDAFVAGFHLGGAQPSTAVSDAPLNAPTPVLKAPEVPQTVTLPGTTQQVSTVTDNFLKSGQGYGAPSAPAPVGEPPASHAGFDLDKLKPAVNGFPGPEGHVYTVTSDGKQHSLEFSTVSGSHFTGLTYSVDGGPNQHRESAASSSDIQVLLTLAVGPHAIKVVSFDNPTGAEYEALWT